MASHAHRYTPAGGKQYTAALMQHQLKSALLRSSNIFPSSISPFIHQPKQNTVCPVQPVVTSVPGKFLTHISKITLENVMSKTAANFYHTLPVTKTPKSLKNGSNRAELARLRSLPLPNLLPLTAVTDPETPSTTHSSLLYTDIPKSCTETSSLATKTVMYSTYHTLPSTKKTATIVEGGHKSNSSSVVMEVTGNVCSSVLSNNHCVSPNPPRLSQNSASLANVYVGVTLSDKPESCAASHGLAWMKAPFTTNNALCPTANSATKAFNTARTNISGNSVRETQKYGEISPSKRPVFLNLHSGGGGNDAKRCKSQSKPPLTNQSLPESPVCENLHSPTGLFQNLTDTESSITSTKFVQQRRSCSYFIDLNTLTSNEQEFCTNSSKNVAKSSESLPATLSQTHLAASSRDNLLDSCDEEDDNGDFSSDSLEEPSEFSNRTPRRCISDYQIFTRPPELAGYEVERRSASAAGRQCKRSREVFRSQESILSNTSDQLSSCNNSGDILEMCSNYEQDRHSSASFFISLRRRESNACRSQESILTDDSEYLMFSHQDVPNRYDCGRYRDSCRSTESILEGDYNFSSMQQENLAAYERTRHRDSCQSTESILTDDSDCQIFSSCNQELQPKNRIFCSVENSGGFGTLSKSELQHSEDGEGFADSVKQAEPGAGTSKRTCGNHRPLFRTQSLQDTSSALPANETSQSASSSEPQTASQILPADHKPLLGKNNEISVTGSLVRKNTYPQSRPQTPNSLQTCTQFSVLNKLCTSGTKGVAEIPVLGDDSSRKSNGGNVQETSHSSQHAKDPTYQHKHSPNRPPTAPKPTGKVTHKPPLKPRQKPSQQQPKQRGQWNSQSLHLPRPLKANHSFVISSVTDVRKAADEIGSMSRDLTEQATRDVIPQDNTSQGVQEGSSGDSKDISHTQMKQKGDLWLNVTRGSYWQEGASQSDTLPKSHAANPVIGRPGGVKLLCRSFENAIEDCDISDDCAEEDSFPVLGGSGSSTPATSSSAANSPKRLWPPASRAPSQRQLGKRLGTRHQILPSKCSGPGNTRPQTLFVACMFA